MAHAGPPLLALFFLFHVSFWMHGIATWQSTNLHRWLQHWRIMPVPWSVLIYRWNHLCLRCLRWKMHCTRRCCRLPWCHSLLFFVLEGKMGEVVLGRNMWQQAAERHTCLLVSVEASYPKCCTPEFFHINNHEALEDVSPFKNLRHFWIVLDMYYIVRLDFKGVYYCFICFLS